MRNWALAPCWVRSHCWSSFPWAVVVQRTRRPYLLVGWLWYLIMLLPVIGLVQVGLQARADRYTYLALTGPCLAAVWGVAEAVRSRRAAPRPVVSLATCAALALLMTAAWRQTTTWRDSMTLWTHALVRVTKADVPTTISLGFMTRKGSSTSPCSITRRPCDCRPIRCQPDVNYGRWLVGRGRVDEGIEQYRIALDIDPQNSAAETDLGLAFVAQRQYRRGRGPLHEGHGDRPGECRGLLQSRQCVPAAGAARRGGCRVRAGA